LIVFYLYLYTMECCVNVAEIRAFYAFWCGGGVHR